MIQPQPQAGSPANKVLAESKPSQFTDSRLSEVFAMAMESKQLNRDLREMIHYKMDALLGPVPPQPTAEKNVVDAPMEGWLDEITYEIDMAIKICRDSLDRLSTL